MRLNRDDCTLYVVYWEPAEVFKVGVTANDSRIRKFQRTGAWLLHRVEHATTAQEAEVLRHVGYAFDRAFTHREDATALLGQWAMGFTECFRVPVRHLLGARELAMLGLRRAS